MRYTTLCYLENPAGEYLMLHRVKKENDCNRDKWIGIGGKFLDGESPEECALRETFEELGLPAEAIEIFGDLDFLYLRSEGLMYPVLGRVDPAAVLHPSPDEVQDTFTAPLSWLAAHPPAIYLSLIHISEPTRP